MKILNLTDDFTPFDPKEYYFLKYKSFIFKGGEPHFRIEDSAGRDTDIMVTTRLNSSSDFMRLAIAMNAMNNADIEWEAIHLVAPYFPGARQDRIMVEGEPLTVKVYADIINTMKFDSVNILDPHSDVTPALLDNCIVTSNHAFIEKILETNHRNTINIVSPDAGSNKKIKDLAKHLVNAYPNKKFKITKCDKTRDVSTGEITGFEIYNTTFRAGETILIVDDICDGGGTFIGLAKKLREYTALPLHLCVTHGIFSQGFKELNKYYDTIYTTNSIRDYGEDYIADYKHHLGYKPNLKQIKIVDE